MKSGLLSLVIIFFFGVCSSNAQAPVASFTSDTSTCVYSCVTFTNNSTNATSWQWTFPGGVPGTSSLQNPGSVCYSLPGSYNVTLIATNANGSDTLTVINQVKVHPFPTLQLTGGQLCDPNKLDWAHWTSVSSGSATGVISSNLSISVTQSAGGLSTTPGMFNPSYFPTQYNVPVSSTAIKNVNAGIFTFCFSSPVVDPQIALSSIGNGSLNVEITTSTPYNIIWAGPGMTYQNDTTFSGKEGYTIVEFPGVQSCISFDYHSSENYCNLAFGVLDTNCQTSNFPPICPGSSVTVTATGNESLQNSFQWTPSEGLNTDTGAVVTATPSVTTTYYATCTANNCSVTDTVTIVVKNVPVPVATISGLSAICFGQSDTLAANSGTKYLWSTGSTTFYIIANSGTTGTYSVTVTDTDACSASAAKTVNVASSLVFKISGDTAFCAGNTTTLDAGSGYSSYLWSTGETSRTIQVDTVGQYTVTITNGSGCTGTSTTHTRFFTAPSTSITGIASFCQGDSSVLDAGGGFAGYQWSTGDINETITVDSATNYGVTVTDHNGCQATASLQVTVKALPVMSISGLTSLCAGDTSILDAGSGFANYNWSTGDTGESIITDTTGNYSVIVTGNNGCTASASASVVLHLPVTTISGSTGFCAGDSSLLDAGAGFASYIWSTGATTETIYVNNSDEYAVTVTDNYGCTSPAAIETAALPLPTTNITGIASFCQGDSTVLDAGGGFTGYLWSTGSSNESITVYSSAIYSVVITDNNGCVGTDSITATENPLPTVQVNGGPLCDPTKLDWAQWTHVDGDSASGTISSGLTISVTQSGGGLGTTGGMFNGGYFPPQYNVPVDSTTIMNQNAGIFTFCFSHPVIDPQIALASIGNESVFVPVTTSAPYNIIWAGPGMSFPNDSTFIGDEGYTIVEFPGVHSCISFDYELPEFYCNIAFGVLDSNCQSTTLSPICRTESVTLTATGNSALQNSFNWTPSDGLNTDTGAVVTAMPSVTTTYLVTCTAGNCSVTDSVVVVVKPFYPPVVSFSGPDSICAGASDTLTASGGATYVWNTGETTPSIMPDPFDAATYTVTVTDTNGCFSTASTAVLYVDWNVYYNSIQNAYFCPGDSAILDPGSGMASYIWSTGATTESINIDTGGSYTVSFMDFLGCSNSSSASTFVYGTPSTSIAGTTSFCRGDSSVLDAGAGFAGYLWSTGALNETITVDSAANYSVTITDNNGCHGTDSIMVSVNPLPVVNISGVTSLCAGDTSTLDAGAGYASYIWSTGDAVESISTDTAGTYSVTVTDNNSCAGTASATVTVNPLPVIPTVRLSGSDTLYCSTDPGYVSYQWFDNTTLIPNATGTFLVITHEGLYHVQVTNSYDCSATGSIDVIFTGLENIEGSSFYIYPNPTQGEFTITTGDVLKNVELKIYNALGELVYEEAFLAKTRTFNIKLTAGIYFIQLTNENGSMLRKLLIE